MSETMDRLGQTDEDIFVPKYSDEDLEAAVGNPQAFPTFTCSQPMCATGGGCGTWPGRTDGATAFSKIDRDAGQFAANPITS